MLDLALANEILDRACDIFYRNLRVDTVLIEEIDPIGPETFQRRLRDLADVRGAAVEACLLPVLDLEAELRGDDDLIANRGECFADNVFVRKRAVHFRRVEEGHAAVDGRPDHGQAVFARRCGPVTEADAHAAEAQR